jgi:hypothetical protein
MKNKQKEKERDIKSLVPLFLSFVGLFTGHVRLATAFCPFCVFLSAPSPSFLLCRLPAPGKAGHRAIGLGQEQTHRPKGFKAGIR